MDEMVPWIAASLIYKHDVGLWPSDTSSTFYYTRSNHTSRGLNDFLLQLCEQNVVVRVAGEGNIHHTTAHKAKALAETEVNDWLDTP